MDEQRTNIKLKPVTKQDIETVWRMQIEAFSELLEKYQDYDMSPAAKSIPDSFNLIINAVLSKLRYQIIIFGICECV